MPLCRKVSAIRYSIIFANEMQADFILFFAVRPSDAPHPHDRAGALCGFAHKGPSVSKLPGALMRSSTHRL